MAELFTTIGGTSGGVAIVMLILFITGQIYPKTTVDDLKEEIDELKLERTIQAQRAEAGVLAGQVVKDVMLSLRGELQK